MRLDANGKDHLHGDDHASLLRYRSGPTSNPAQPPPPPNATICGGTLP